MDRLDAMKMFVAVLDEGSLVGASRKTGRSAATVGRAIAFLEEHAGVPLLHRTTRSIRLSEAGERYEAACRKALAILDEADRTVAAERSVPRGTLTITTTMFVGLEILRPVVDAFINEYPTVSVRLHLLERTVNLIEEGMDLALRIDHLTDSTMVAHRIGESRRVVVASPEYLASHPQIIVLSDLDKHQIIAVPHTGIDSWSFPPQPGSVVPRSISFTPRLLVNSFRSAVDSAVDGYGITRVLAYHAAPEIRQGKLRVVLVDMEPESLPINIVTPNGRLSVPKVRAFVDFALPRLRARFASLAEEAKMTPDMSIQSSGERLSSE